MALLAEDRAPHSFQLSPTLSPLPPFSRTGSALEHLDDGLLARHLQDLALALLPVPQCQVDDLGELGQLDVVEDDQGTVHALDGRVLFWGEGGREDEWRWRDTWLVQSRSSVPGSGRAGIRVAC